MDKSILKYQCNECYTNYFDLQDAFYCCRPKDIYECAARIIQVKKQINGLLAEDE